MTIWNALSRFILCPLIVAVGDTLFRGVSYAGVNQWIYVGWVLAVLSLVMDMTLLDRLGHAGAFFADTLAATLVVGMSPFVLPAATVTMGGALGTGLLLGASEILMHRWVQASRRAGVRDDRP